MKEIDVIDDKLEQTEPMQKPNCYLTTNEVTELLGNVTPQYIYKLLKSLNVESFLTSNKRRLIPSTGVRKILESKNFSFPKFNISFQIVKGGVGKTSLSFSFALRASHFGAKVLVIDMDQQANLTRSFNYPSRNRPVWIDILRKDYSVEDAIININDNLDLIPSNLNNSRLDTELTQMSINLKDMLNDSISSIRDNYDIVIFDCPPAINKINTAVTCASDMILIPINPDPYAMDGLSFTISELKKLRKEFKLDNEYRLLWNRYDAREKLGTIYLHEIAKDTELLEKLLPIVIGADSSLKNSIFNEKSVFDLPRNTSIKADITSLTMELLGISKWKNS